MKRKALILCTVLTALLIGFTAQPTASDHDYRYLALVTGCSEDSASKKKVVNSFGQLDGVKKVRFLRQKKDNLHQVVIDTEDDAEISLADAVKAIEHLQHYELVRWEANEQDG